MTDRDDDEYRPLEAPMPPLPPEGSRPPQPRSSGYAGPPLPPAQPAPPRPPLSADEQAIIQRYAKQGRKLVTMDELIRQANAAAEEAHGIVSGATPLPSNPVTPSQPPAPTSVAPPTTLATRQDRECSRCGGPTNPARMVANVRLTSYDLELHPAMPGMFDSRMSRLRAIVCESCGYVDFFAVTPRSLRPEDKR